MELMVKLLLVVHQLDPLSNYGHSHKPFCSTTVNNRKKHRNPLVQTKNSTAI